MSAVLDVPLGTVKSRTARAIAALAAELAGTGRGGLPGTGRDGIVEEQ